MKFEFVNNWMVFEILFSLNFFSAIVLLIILLICIANFIDSQRLIHTEYHPNGKKKYQVKHLRQRKLESMVEWDDTGQKTEEKRLWTKLLDKSLYRHKEWYPTGQLQRKYSELNREKHGKYISKYSNGRKQEVSYWHFGKKHGRQTHWYPNGQKFLDYYCVFGKLEGKRRTWDIYGRKIRIEHYRKGMQHGKYQSWHENGQCYELFSKKYDLLEGKFERWNEQGLKLQEKYWHKDKYHGRIRKWNSEGKEIENQVYVFGYRESTIMIILHAFRKAKWYRLARLTKTRAFNEWWYDPNNVGGRLWKKRLELSLKNMISQ